MAPLAIATDAPLQAPMPAWVYRILNPTLKFLLRSPLHRVMSHGGMILIFTGRKTGKRYDVVVTYTEEGGKLYTFSNTRWSKNFIGGASVALRLRGELVRATALVVDDLALIGRVIQRMRHNHGDPIVKGMGLNRRWPRRVRLSPDAEAQSAGRVHPGALKGSRARSSLRPCLSVPLSRWQRKQAIDICLLLLHLC
jgi:hypothetical protein